MKLPLIYSDDFLGYERGTPLPDDLRNGDVKAQRAIVYSLIFPPIGFFPFYGIGNGDYHGFYWPIGREEGPPFVAFSSHDAWSLIPEHSSIGALYASQLARSEGRDDTLGSYRELVELATGELPRDHETRGVAHNDFSALLAFDRDSPYYLCAAGDTHLAKDEIDLAEEKYRRSLSQLPEYVAAHFGLASVLRRQRRGEEATIHLRRALIGPLAFYGGSFWADTSLPGSFRSDWARKSLMWLQGSKQVSESLVDDPFVKRINELTFKSGLAHNPDIDVLQTIVEEYATAGVYSEAALIWQLIGDRAALETTSFRERYNLNPFTYGNRLVELLQLAGHDRRATLVRNMLNNLRDSKALHL